MTRASKQSSPQVRHARLIKPLEAACDLLVQAQIERGSEAHPGNAELQIKYDEYLDAVELARRSGDRSDTLQAGRLYLAYVATRNEQENRL